MVLNRCFSATGGSRCTGRPWCPGRGGVPRRNGGHSGTRRTGCQGVSWCSSPIRKRKHPAGLRRAPGVTGQAPGVTGHREWPHVAGSGYARPGTGSAHTGARSDRAQGVATWAQCVASDPAGTEPGSSQRVAASRTPWSPAARALPGAVTRSGGPHTRSGHAPQGDRAPGVRPHHKE